MFPYNNHIAVAAAADNAAWARPTSWTHVGGANNHHGWGGGGDGTASSIIPPADTAVSNTVVTSVDLPATTVVQPAGPASSVVANPNSGAPPSYQAADSIATTTAAANLPTGNTGTTSSSAGCSCGYLLPDYNNAYFISQVAVDMSTLGSVTDLTTHGINIADDYETGANDGPSGTYCQASKENVKLNGGVLEMSVPGE